jgi:hypothetical protein
LLLSCFRPGIGQTAVAVPTPIPPGEHHPAQTTGHKVKRWFEIDILSISLRHRLIRNASDVTIDNSAQFQLNSHARFKLDEKAKYTVHFGLFTGDSIIGGWNRTGLGTGDAKTNLYLKQLYFAAKPVKGLEVQIGGIGINNGLSTEITGYDNDAYLMGERVTVRTPKKAYFDEISATAGFFGDENSPSVFDRFKRLDQWNYYQFLVKKQLDKRIAFSADYTFERGRDFLRQAVTAHVPESRIFDSVHFENYQRLDPTPGYGFSAFGDKTVHKNVALRFGFSRIDRTMFNGDRYPPGKRLFAGANWQMTREFAVQSVIIQGVGDLPSANSHRTRFELIFTFNVLETLRRYKLH